MAAVKAVAKVLIDALEKGGGKRMLKVMNEKGIQANKAISVLSHRHVPISDSAKLRAVRALSIKDLSRFGLHTPSPQQVKQLANTIGDVGLREHGAKVAKLFAEKVAKAGKASSKPAVAPKPGAISKGSPLSGEARKRVADRISTLLSQRRELKDVADKTAGEAGKAVGEMQKELTKAGGPRYLKAAALLGGGLALGSMGSATKPPQQEAAKAMIAELLLNQQGTVDRQKLVDAQAELTKARTFEVLNRILNQGNQAAKATPFG